MWSVFLTSLIEKMSMILCARSTSRSREQSTKRGASSVNVWKVCSFDSHNNKILWLWFMRNLKIYKARKGIWAFSLDCAFRMLIGWAGKLQSHGRYFRVNMYIPCRGTWGLLISWLVLSKRQKKNMTAAFFSFRSSRVLAAASLLLFHS